MKLFTYIKGYYKLKKGKGRRKEILITGHHNVLDNHLSRKIADGVVFESLYSDLDLLANFISLYRDKLNNNIFLDPQIYLNKSNIKKKFGIKTSDSNRSIVDKVIERNLELGIKKVITPNVILNSPEYTATEFKNFIETIKFSETSELCEIYPSLVLDHTVLASQNDPLVTEILSAKGKSVKGFYILVNGDSSGYDIVKGSSMNNQNIICNLMFLIYSLSKRGLKIVVGCSDILTPFLNLFEKNVSGVLGGSEEFRVFNVGKFGGEGGGGGGGQNLARYLSNQLLVRVERADLLSMLRKNIIQKNGVDSDKFYYLDGSTGELPAPRKRVIQMLETLRNISTKTRTTEEKWKVLNNAVKLVEKIDGRPEFNFTKEKKYLENLQKGFRKFRELSEI